jgi:CheY-like chemotaxis protein
MKKVLVIDDNKGILKSLELVLTTLGHESRMATNKAEALMAIEKFTPDIIFLDLLLSGENGVDICMSFKQNPATQDIPVVMMSAHPSAEKTIADSGAVGFLPKPFSLQSIIEFTDRYT